MRQYIQYAGFTPPAGRALGGERRTAVFAELVATVGLTLCVLVAATVVMIALDLWKLAT